MKLKYSLLTIIFFLLPMQFTKSDDIIIEIDNPKFSEKGLNDSIYEIKAQKGFKSDNNLELFVVEGKFKKEKNGKWMYLKADKGNFSQLSNFIELNNNIVFYTDEGETFKSNHAIFDMTNDVIKMKNNVSHENSDGIIFSDSSVITDNFDKITYQGNVVSTIKK